MKYVCTSNKYDFHWEIICFLCFYCDSVENLYNDNHKYFWLQIKFPVSGVFLETDRSVFLLSIHKEGILPKLTNPPTQIVWTWLYYCRQHFSSLSWRMPMGRSQSFSPFLGAGTLEKAGKYVRHLLRSRRVCAYFL